MRSKSQYNEVDDAELFFCLLLSKVKVGSLLAVEDHLAIFVQE